MVTPTATPRKVRFKGQQMAAYRFVFCVTDQLEATTEDVVRHRCHNRSCINPDHLEIGSKEDNKRDDWEVLANGLDFGLL
jgi:hypothetical protein